MSIEARFRAAERRLLATNGVDASERVLRLAHPATNVRVQESGTGDPIVFLNGISAPGAGFAPLLPHVAGRHVLVDLPGHALSDPFDWDGDSLRRVAVSVVTGVLDGLGLDRVPIVANSLGGMIALWTSLDAPERVSRLVLVGEPAVALPGARGSAMMGMLTSPAFGRAFQWSMNLPSPRFLVRQMMRGAIGADAAGKASDDLIDVHALALRLPGRARSFRSLLRRVLDGRTPRPENVLTDAELRRITEPTLFVWGDGDVFLGPDAGRVSVDAMPGARLEVVPGGHDPWIDDPVRVGALVAAFLDAAPRSPSTSV